MGMSSPFEFVAVESAIAAAVLGALHVPPGPLLPLDPAVLLGRDIIVWPDDTATPRGAA